MPGTAVRGGRQRVARYKEIAEDLIGQIRGGRVPVGAVLVRDGEVSFLIRNVPGISNANWRGILPAACCASGPRCGC